MAPVNVPALVSEVCAHMGISGLRMGRVTDRGWSDLCEGLGSLFSLLVYMQQPWLPTLAASIRASHLSLLLIWLTSGARRTDRYAQS